MPGRSAVRNGSDTRATVACLPAIAAGYGADLIGRCALQRGGGSIDVTPR
jgi:hypothetical protein